MRNLQALSDRMRHNNFSLGFAGRAALVAEDWLFLEALPTEGIEPTLPMKETGF
jgi:hypothetical protein